MKKLLGFIPSYLFFYIGDLISRIMYKINSRYPYILYNFFMDKSSYIQDWAGLKGPWKNVNK